MKKKKEKMCLKMYTHIAAADLIFFIQTQTWYKSDSCYIVILRMLYSRRPYRSRYCSPPNRYIIHV